MGSLTSSLVVSLIDRVTAPAKAVAASMGALNNRLRAMSGSHGMMAGRLQGQMFGAIAAGYSLQRALAAPIAEASRFETAMLDIGQKADLGDAAIKALGARIRALAPTINQTSAEVARGIDTLVGFGLDPERAETLLAPIGRAATAYNAAIDDLAKAGFSTLDNLKVKAEDFGQALDVMAQSGKEGAFEIKDMAAEFPALTASAQALKMEGVTAVGRLTAALQIARKGAASGSEAATNTANLMQKIISPETTRKFTKLGVDIRKELKKTQASGGDVFEMIAAQTSKALKGDLSKLGDLFEDAQVQKFLRPLMQNLDEYRKIRDKALAAKGVVDADFGRRMLTSAARTAAFTIRLRELAISIGNILLPAMNELTGSLSPLVRSVETFADAHPQLVGGAIKVTAALIAARVAAIAARYAFRFLSAAFLGIAAPALGAVVALGRLAKLAVVAGMIRPVTASLVALRAGLLGLAVVGALGGVRMAIAGMAAGMLALLNPLRLLPALLGGVALAMRGLGSAMLMVPGAAALLAIGAAGMFIYNNWKGLGKFFSALFTSLKGNLEGIDGGRFKGLIDSVESVGQAWQRWTGTVSDKAWAEAGASAGRSLAEAIKGIADAIDAVLQKWQSFKDAWNAIHDVLNTPIGEAVGKALAREPGAPSKDQAARQRLIDRFNQERRDLNIPIIGAPPAGPSAPAPGPTSGQNAEPSQIDFGIAAAFDALATRLGALLDRLPDMSLTPGTQRATPGAGASGPAAAAGAKTGESYNNALGEALRGADIWTGGAPGIRHLDQSGPAGAAGTATGHAYKSALGGELKAAEADIQAFVRRATAMLSFSASPSITPKIGALPSGAGAGGGGKGASLEGIAARQHAAFADYGFNTV